MTGRLLFFFPFFFSKQTKIDSNLKSNVCTRSVPPVGRAVYPDLAETIREERIVFSVFILS